LMHLKEDDKGRVTTGTVTEAGAEMGRGLCETEEGTPKSQKEQRMRKKMRGRRLPTFCSLTSVNITSRKFAPTERISQREATNLGRKNSAKQHSRAGE